MICCDGLRIACYIGPAGQPDYVRDCILAHESTHGNDIDCPKRGISREFFKPGKVERVEECEGYLREMLCLRGKKGYCANRYKNDPVGYKVCKDYFDFYIDDRSKRCTANCGKNKLCAITVVSGPPSRPKNA